MVPRGKVRLASNATLHEAAGGDGRKRANKPGKRGQAHGGWKGKCWLKDCCVTKPKRTQTICPGCGHYFHLPCFMKAHACARRPAVELCGECE